MSQSTPPREEPILARLERQEMEIERLKNTLKGVAREVGNLSISGRCERCRRSYLLVRDGYIYCPKCKNGHPL
ncbi:hypothetical protein [Halosimplex salinum]|uniref:hypothetical protein n=1 Tax=Halosimplex salinum TaxID=1710538 RepID=UPI000F46A098|nr:hypothetical protein [Halosimplex salinum]